MITAADANRSVISQNDDRRSFECVYSALMHHDWSGILGKYSTGAHAQRVKTRR